MPTRKHSVVYEWGGRKGFLAKSVPVPVPVPIHATGWPSTNNNNTIIETEVSGRGPLADALLHAEAASFIVRRGARDRCMTSSATRYYGGDSAVNTGCLGSLPTASLQRDVHEERTVIALLEESVRLGLASLDRQVDASLRSHEEGSYGDNNTINYTGGEANASLTTPTYGAASLPLSAEEEETTIDTVVEASENAVRLLLSNAGLCDANAVASPLECLQRAVAIAASLVARVRSYRTLCCLGWAQLNYALSVRDVGLRVQIEEGGVVLCMLEALGDLEARLAMHCGLEGGAGAPALEPWSDGDGRTASPPLAQQQQQQPLGSLLSVCDAMDVALVEIRCAVALGVCERYSEVIACMEATVGRADLAAAVDAESAANGSRRGNASIGHPSPAFSSSNLGGGDGAALCYSPPYYMEGILPYALAANAHSAALDGYELASLCVEGSLSRYPSHPLAHLLWCLLQARLGSDISLISTRLSHVLRGIADAIGVCEGTPMGCLYAPSRGEEEAVGVERGIHAALRSAGTDKGGHKVILALLRLTAVVALRCGGGGPCEDVALAAVGLGMELMGYHAPDLPPDHGMLAHFLTVKADVCLRKAMATFRASLGSLAATDGAGTVRAGGASGCVGDGPLLLGDAEALMLQCERHLFRALQLDGGNALAHLVSGRRLCFAAERARDGTAVQSDAADVRALSSRALLSFEAAIRCNPRLGEAYEGAGQCHAEAGRLAEASELLLTAVSLQSRRPLIPFEWFMELLA